MSGTKANASKKSNLILEELPEIRENLIKETEECGGFMAIAQLQEPIFLTNDKDQILCTAQRLNVAYNTDLLAELEARADESEKDSEPDTNTKSNDGAEKTHKCGNCFGEAEKKCSNCKMMYYCSR